MWNSMKCLLKQLGLHNKKRFLANKISIQVIWKNWYDQQAMRFGRGFKSGKMGQLPEFSISVPT